MHTHGVLAVRTTDARNRVSPPSPPALRVQTRINGGTNIEAAINMAGSLMGKATAKSGPPQAAPGPSAAAAGAAGAQAAAAEKAAAEVHAAAGSVAPPARMVILLTDGRVDRYQVCVGGQVPGVCRPQVPGVCRYQVCVGQAEAPSLALPNCLARRSSANLMDAFHGWSTCSMLGRSDAQLAWAE